MKVKRTLEILGVGVVKNGCGQSCDGTLKFVRRMSKWNKLSFCMLMKIHNS